MDTESIIGLVGGGVFGLLGLGAAIFAAIYATGAFEYLGGKKSNPNAVDKQTLLNRLLALNDSSKPYHIIKGEDTDLTAEWKIVDASWYGIFRKSGLTEWYKASLLVDETRHTVRCLEEEGSIDWIKGTKGLMPALEYEKSGFRGKILFHKSGAIGFGIKDLDTIEVGKIYEYKFDVNDIRKPIVEVIEENGWEFVSIRAKRHAIYK
jgi:hypothetical protein